MTVLASMIHITTTGAGGPDVLVPTAGAVPVPKAV